MCWNIASLSLILTVAGIAVPAAPSVLQPRTRPGPNLGGSPKLERSGVLSREL